MKKIVVGALLSVGLAATIAYGHGNGYFRGGGHHMMGPGMHMMGSGPMMQGGGNYGACPGRGGHGAWNQGYNQEFFDATADLRKQMHDKRFELMEARRNPQATQQQVLDLQQEMLELRNQMQAQAQKYSGSVQ